MSNVSILNHLFFAERVGKTFQVHVNDKTANLKLVKISELNTTPRQERFSIEFEGPRDSIVPQGEYRMECETDSFNLFIVPVEQTSTATIYEAVFNRLRDAD